jgi:maltose alpha-D-glucosyltransferase / alpha-amylase
MHSTGRAAQKMDTHAEWYKDAILYELHVRSFQDSNDDGIGDFPGLTRRLGYLRNLGVTAIWLLPFYPSPLRDDGYDISDYLGVHPDYGMLEDFDTFVAEAHRLGLRVFTELVINHTSDQHRWFERARRAPRESAERNFYVWSDTPERYAGTRVIFQDFERSNWTWDPIAQAYYWHRFYGHQPDLNYRSPQVLEAVLGVLDFWFARGVDGMRLDAVPYLMEEEGTSSENLAETHAILKAIRRHVDERHPRRAFIAEANQWPEDAVAYFGEGDESHMVFHFPLMPRLFMAVRQEDRFPVEDILAQTPEPPAGCQWALFLRNHDELTLEMVTEEERLFMYHVYAADPTARINLGIRRRLAPLLGNDRRRIELLNTLLFSLPGTPVLYYGDEIGMGDNVYLGDRNGVRTPMQWSADRNAGFSNAEQQRLFLPLITSTQFHHQTNHVEAQEHSQHSLLQWMRRTLAVRKRYQAFSRGLMTLLPCANTRILAFVRSWREQHVLVVANLSRFVQHVAIDLSAYGGRVPVDVFGRGPFPAITTEPYTLTLGPHGTIWLELTSTEASNAQPGVPMLSVRERCDELLHQPRRADFEGVLAGWIETQLVFHTRRRPVLRAALADAFDVEDGTAALWALVVCAEFSVGEPQLFLLLVRCLADDHPASCGERPLAEVRTASGQRFLLRDVLNSAEGALAIVRQTATKRHCRGLQGELRMATEDEVPALRPLAATVITLDRPSGNAVVALDDALVVKLYRQVEAGVHPEVEFGRMLRSAAVPHVPPFVASLNYEWRDPGRRTATIGVIHRFEANEGEAWTRSVAAAGAFLEQALRSGDQLDPVLIGQPLRAAGNDGRQLPSPSIVERMGAYTRFLARLAVRLSELHLAAAAADHDPAFAPEPYTILTRRSIYQHVRTRLLTVLEQLRLAERMPPDLQAMAAQLQDERPALLALIAEVLATPLTGRRIRCHGNLHLGQVLHVGRDLLIIDFEGEAERPLFERRVKRTPLLDVVALLRSFAYAAAAALEQRRHGAPDAERAAAWSQIWQDEASAIFVGHYRQRMDGSGLLPTSQDEWRRMFTLALIDRIAHEIGTELHFDRGWVRYALRDMLSIARSAQ